MTYTFREFYIPDHMMEGLTRYVSQHSPVGDFLLAVLENNLKNAISRADEENLSNLPAYLGWLYNEAPSACWGSPARVTTWLKMRGNTELDRVKTLVGLPVEEQTHERL